MTRLVVFVDVDDTLVRTAGPKRLPMSAVIEHVRSLWCDGAELYCWSSGGADYARASAAEVGLAECFAGYLPKPNVLIDDRAVGEWSRCLTIHPGRVVAMTLDDYRRELDGEGG